MQQPLVEFASKVFSELSRGVRTIVSTERRIGKHLSGNLDFARNFIQEFFTPGSNKVETSKDFGRDSKDFSRARIYFCFYREKGKKKKTFLKSKPVREKSSRKFLGGSKLRILF